MLFFYCRVSSTGQDLALQERCAAELGADRVFRDVAISGSVRGDKRPAFAEMQSMVREGDTVATYRLDRIGRSTIDVLSILQDWKERGIKFQSVSDGIVPGTPAGDLFLGLVALVAEYERSVIRERTRDGIAAARLAGRQPGRPRKNLPDDVLRRVNDLRSTGMSMQDVARQVGVSRSKLYAVLAAK